MKTIKRSSSLCKLDHYAEKINKTSTSAFRDFRPSRSKSENSLQKGLLLETHAICFKYFEENQRKCSNYRSLILANNSTIKWMKENEQKLGLELERVRRDISIANKEKELAVVQYAVAEKNLIDVRNQRKDFETKNAKMKREIEQLNLKIKSQVHENDMVRRIVDEKCTELRGAQREIQRMKTDVVELETKMKWNTVKLKQEINARMEAEKKVVFLQDENNRLKHNQAVLDENTNSPKITDKAVVEMEAKLILYKHASEEKQKLISNLEEQVDNLKETNSRLNGMPEQLIALQQQHSDLQADHQVKDNQILELNSRIIDLELKLDEMEASHKELVDTNTNSAKEIENLSTLTLELEDLRKEIKQLHEEEEHILQINQMLTQKSVEMQNELVMTQHKSTAIITENAKVRTDFQTLQTKLSAQQSRFELESAEQDQERLSVARIISEKARTIDMQRVQIEGLMNEMEAEQKKHQNVVKELHREVQCMRRETERDKLLSGTSSPEQHSSTINSTPSASPPDDTPMPLSHEILVRRIVKLQQALARQTEKIDFLENHSASLLMEVQKKTKFIQMCMLNNDFKLPPKISIAAVEKMLNAREKHKS